MKHLFILFATLLSVGTLVAQHTEIEYDSEGGDPQLLLTETGAGGGFSRLTFENENPGHWTFAARTGPSATDDDFSLFYNNGTLGFNILNVDGDLGVFNFESDLKINRNRGTDPNVIFDVEDGNIAEINFEANSGQEAYFRYFAQQNGTAIPPYMEISTPGGENFLTMFSGSGGASNTFGPSALGSGGGGGARLRVVHNSNANDGILRLIETEATDFARMFFTNQGSSNRFAIASNPGNADPRMDLGFNGTSQLTIDGDDELVGVNTNPMYTLHVEHGSNSPSVAGSTEGLNITNSGNDDSWTFYTRTNSGGDLQLYYDNLTTPASTVPPALRGTFDSSNGAYTNTSDIRLKKNITTLENQLGKVLSLRPTRYQFKDNSNEPDEYTLGLIAQEVQKVIPEVVAQITDLEEDGTDYLGIAYAELIPVLIGAIQEQQEIIDSQKDQMTAMQSKIDDVLSMVVSLSADTDDSLKTTSED